MRILLVHNYYGSGAPSGENIVVDAEEKLLIDGGNEVIRYSRYSDDVRRQGTFGLIRASLSTPWNPFSARRLSEQVNEIRPDIVHVHNTFPMISPSIFHSIGSGIAKVITLHNYRLLCPAAIPMRNGNVCTECIYKRSVLPSLLHGCYRGSRLSTVPLAANVALHRKIGTWNSKVDAFIALSQFQKDQMVMGGFPKEKIHVKPNFYAGDPEWVPISARENCVVFVGRLGAEKGVKTLLEAWRRWGDSAPLLRVIGDGPLRQYMESESQGLNIEFKGQVQADIAQQYIARSRLLVLPSEWFEGFPMVLREAFAFGTPSVVSDLGPLPSIVQNGVNGVVFQAGNSYSLLTSIRETFFDTEKLCRMSASARQSFESLYTEKTNYKQLIGIYERAREVSQLSRK
ncbi:glycosyltransferase family 4 protein [Pseudohongiella sp. O18]|uniref:glycosyltransferase family 4 protein n=1 Tax=Pseudohongiella sp. O18 TaxID=2904248 RepID=UPI001F27C9A7|nr:glycosyltransferase family 4 protein [Pseudohongiella sp. O18]